MTHIPDWTEDNITRDYLNKRGTHTKPYCLICQKDLEQDEEDYCAKCRVNIEEVWEDS